MKIVVDTNIIRKAMEFSLIHLTVLTNINQNSHNLILDFTGKLENEYRKRCGTFELFQKWYQAISSNCIYSDGKTTKAFLADLRKVGLHEPIDQIVAALAQKVSKYIITEDSDFGHEDSPKGLAKKEVQECLSEIYGITINNADEANSKLITK